MCSEQITAMSSASNTLNGDSSSGMENHASKSVALGKCHLSEILQSQCAARAVCQTSVTGTAAEERTWQGQGETGTGGNWQSEWWPTG